MENIIVAAFSQLVGAEVPIVVVICLLFFFVALGKYAQDPTVSKEGQDD